MPRADRMDQGFSVFNLHVNKAGERADAEFIAQYGQEEFDAEIKPFHDAGIMSIFEAPSTWTVAVWITLVTAYVNEGRG